MTDGDDGLLAALKGAADTSDTDPAPPPNGDTPDPVVAAFTRYKDKGDLESFRALIDELLDEGEGE